MFVGWCIPGQNYPIDEVKKMGADVIIVLMYKMD
jgi:hypothetical protein